PKWQERPIAAVLKEDLAATPENLREFLGRSFAKWQLPDAFVFVEAIPRTSVGKFKKSALRQQFADWKWEGWCYSRSRVCRFRHPGSPWETSTRRPSIPCHTHDQVQFFCHFGIQFFRWGKQR